jgi:hypothetical protein
MLSCFWVGFTGVALEAQRIADMLLQQEAANSGKALVEKKLNASDKLRQDLEVDLKLADAERTRLRQEVERLSMDLKQERLTVATANKSNSLPTPPAVVGSPRTLKANPSVAESTSSRVLSFLGLKARQGTVSQKVDARTAAFSQSVFPPEHEKERASAMLSDTEEKDTPSARTVQFVQSVFASEDEARLEGGSAPAVLSETYRPIPASASGKSNA